MNAAEKHAFLVVDDEQNVLDSICDLLRSDYTLFCARNADEARGVLREESIQIVMSDQRMPRLTGVDLLKEIKEHYPDTVRMIFTGYADLQVVVQAINDGQVFRYLTKPWDPEELKATVRQAAEYYDLVSERKRLLVELERANTDLYKANLLKAAFLDVAGHELSTPVTVILGMTELANEHIEQTNENGSEFIAYVRVVRSAVERLKHLIENMLKLLQVGSFQTAAERQLVGCRALFGDVADQVAPFLKRRRQNLHVTVDPEETMISVDRTKMHDVILNLVMNAIKFSPDGSPIELRAVAANGRPVTIEVADSGVGISDQDLPHIFEPFFTSFNTLAHSSGSHEFRKRGFGMGLAIVKKFVEMHGASLRVRSGQSAGTKFVIQLPI